MECREIDGKLKIGGYINAVDRFSKVMTDKDGKKFIEKIKPGAFKKALDNAKKEGYNIPLLFRHKSDRILSTNIELREDNIGLRFDCEIQDHDIYERVKSGELQCSFGFTRIYDEIREITEKFYTRSIEQLRLLEVTLTPYPSYNGSLVEIREGEEESQLNFLMEIREVIDDMIGDSTTQEHKNDKDDLEQREIERKKVEDILLKQILYGGF